MKYIKTYQQVKESWKDVLVGAAFGTTALTSCEKPDNKEYNIKFGSKTGTIVTDTTPDAQEDFVGGEKTYVIKQAEPSNWESSIMAFQNPPTPEQWVIMFSYKNNLQEKQKNAANPKKQYGVFYDLEDIEVTETPTKNIQTEVDNNPFYIEAWEWCNEEGFENFQKDLENLESKPIDQRGALKDLVIFDPRTILNNNKPKSKK